MQGSGQGEVTKAGLGNLLKIGAKWVREIENLLRLDVAING